MFAFRVNYDTYDISLAIVTVLANLVDLGSVKVDPAKMTP